MSRRSLPIILLTLLGAMALVRVSPALAASTADNYPYKYTEPSCGWSCWGVSDPPQAPNYMFDPWGFNKRNCTSWVAWKLITSGFPSFRNVMKGPNGRQAQFGHANHWDGAARYIGYSVNRVASPGAVAGWDNLNHVAFVESVNADGSANVSEYNFSQPPSGLFGTRRDVRADWYIHF